jgi:hypothetical protein
MRPGQEAPRLRLTSELPPARATANDQGYPPLSSI